MTEFAELNRESNAWRAVGHIAGALARESGYGRRTDVLDVKLGQLSRIATQLGIRSTPTTISPAQESAMRTARLSEREMQVLLGMTQGLSNAEIGRELNIAEDTVKTHARRMYKKLKARDRASAVAVGFRSGLVR